MPQIEGCISMYLCTYLCKHASCICVGATSSTYRTYYYVSTSIALIEGVV